MTRTGPSEAAQDNFEVAADADKGESECRGFDFFYRLQSLIYTRPVSLKSNSCGQSTTSARCKFEIMTKDYINDQRSKANKTKRQAQKNAQDIKSLWRKSTNRSSATVNERSSRTSPAVAASQSLAGNLHAID